MLTAIAALALFTVQGDGPAAQDQDLPKPGVWEAFDRTSALDGRRVATQTLMSSNEVTLSSGQKTPAMLMLRCADKNLTAVVAWPGAYMGSGLIPVVWRVNDAPPRKEVWQPVQGQPSVAELYFTRRFVDALAAGGRLLMRVQSYGTAQELEFSLGDSAGAVKAIRAACPK